MRKAKLAIAYLGLGSNLGDREQNLAQALRLLSLEVTIDRVSSVYETEPVGYGEQPLFLNAVCQVSTNLSPQELLILAKSIEAKLGRLPSFANASRPIDVDILFYDDQLIETQDLTIPHPRLVERAFVLIPLAEIAPDLVHLGNGKSIAELASRFGESNTVWKWHKN